MGPNGDNCEQGVELGWGPLFPKDRCELEGCGNQRTSRLDCGPAEALLAGTEESTSHMITENHVSEEAVTLVAKGVIMGMSTRIHSQTSETSSSRPFPPPPYLHPPCSVNYVNHSTLNHFHLPLEKSSKR